MKYFTSVDSSGMHHYEISDPVSSIKFFSWMDKLAASYGIAAEYFMIPEADIGRIVFPKGKIFAKLDFAYGLEIECSGLSEAQLNQLNEALAAW